MKAPCYKCEDRTVTCHTTCEKYIAFKNFRNEQSRMVNKKRQDDLLIYEYHYDKSVRLNKNKYKKY